jgi:hypothetical protein
MALPTAALTLLSLSPSALLNIDLTVSLCPVASRSRCARSRCGS